VKVGKKTERKSGEMNLAWKHALRNVYCLS